MLKKQETIEETEETIESFFQSDWPLPDFGIPNRSRKSEACRNLIAQVLLDSRNVILSGVEAMLRRSRNMALGISKQSSASKIFRGDAKLYTTFVRFAQEEVGWVTEDAEAHSNTPSCVDRPRFSFVFVCHSLGLNPDYIRKSIKEDCKNLKEEFYSTINSTGFDPPLNWWYVPSGIHAGGKQTQVVDTCGFE